MRALALITLMAGLSACASVAEKPVDDNLLTMTGRIVDLKTAEVYVQGHRMLNWDGTRMTEPAPISTLRVFQNQLIDFYGRCEDLSEHVIKRSLPEVTVTLRPEPVDFAMKSSSSPAFVLQDCKVHIPELLGQT